MPFGYIVGDGGGFDKSLLCNVLRLARIVHVTHYQLQHLVLVSQNQQIEGRPFAALDSFHQLEVAFLDTHQAKPVAIDRGSREKFDNSGAGRLKREVVHMADSMTERWR